jgi:hypothetical protein
MVEEGLLAMLLQTLHGLLHRAAEPLPSPVHADEELVDGTDDDDEPHGARLGVPPAFRDEDAAPPPPSAARATAAEPMDVDVHSPSVALPAWEPEAEAAAAAAADAAAEAEHVVSAKSPVISTHLYSQLAYDVRYTLNHPPLAIQLISRPLLIPLLMRCLALVQGSSATQTLHTLSLTVAITLSHALTLILALTLALTLTLALAQIGAPSPSTLAAKPRPYP